MKLTAVAVTLILLLLPGYHDVNRPQPPAAPQDSQVKNAELENLEEQLKRIEQEADSVKVNVKGDKESSATITITGEREVPLAPPPPEAANANTSNANTSSGNVRASRMRRRRRGGGGAKSVSKKETLLDIDLSKLKIPDEYIKEKVAAVMANQTMCGSIPGVTLIQVGVTENYQVVNDYIYAGDAYRITVFKGFIYDRSSIPRVFWAIIDKDSLGNVAPLLHDLLYRNGGVLPTNQISPYRKFSRKDVDDLFLELMTKCGVSEVRRALAYQAVRKFGWFAWKG